MQVFTFAHALRSKPYALLWMGQTISMLGNYVFIPVLGWQTLQLTHSATATAIVETTAAIPMVLFSPFRLWGLFWRCCWLDTYDDDEASLYLLLPFCFALALLDWVFLFPS